MLPAIVLCGGFGTRLRSVVEDRPKVLAPINGNPFLDYLLLHISAQTCRRVILSTGYLAELVERYVGDGSRWGLQVHFAREEKPLGTAGAVRFAYESAGLSGDTLVLNGDTFFTGSLEHLVTFHQTHANSVGTLALAWVPQTERYGSVRIDPITEEIAAFEEKVHRSGPSWINAGTYAVSEKLIETVPPDRNVSLERDVFPRWIKKGIYGCRFPDSVFLDIGTPEDYSRAAGILVNVQGDRRI